MIPFPPADRGQTELFGEPDRLALLSLAAHIIVIDDEVANVRMLKRMLEAAGFHTVTGLTDARQLHALVVQAPPDLVITDLHMPDLDGFAVLDVLTPLINQERLPVLVVTGDSSRDARQQALTRGAKDYVTKPFDIIEVLLRVRNLLETRMLFQDLRKQNRTLLESASGRTRELESTRIEMIERLALAAECRDEQTSDHNQRVGLLSARLAESIGWTAEDADLLRRAAALHDIGKIGIPDALLRKPGGLTEGELRVMRTHTSIGARIVGGSHVPLLQLAEAVAMSHHERWDGTGYPRGLAGSDIPIAGRIVAVADAFDAMTNNRPYRPARPLVAALATLRELRDCHYEARLVDALDAIVADDAWPPDAAGPDGRNAEHDTCAGPAFSEPPAQRQAVSNLAASCS
ncbi:MAG TPA: HD domain-containing phosphohydrolase [Vicinamibacterales bacterium]|nr:HD domain-containing phosphohydrolase [Vicinamibacterales bacterium]